ncbi:MAG: AAA family ATPase [Chloroflexota bacterium]|nr:AAA family ATPase [Chloroflexota bacterium]
MDATEAASVGAPGPSSGSERRLVSVLFADLVGFTTLSEVRDAEEVRDLLTRYFDLAQQIIDRYGGTVEKFIGDAVMAVWGTPTAHEDDAERAVRAGLDLVDAVHQLGASLGADDLQLRAGVLTGEAAVTMGATNQGMVAGDLVNTASRLQSVAPPGSVLVGESTMRTAAGAIAFEPVGEQALKGKAAPVPAYRALRVVARRGGAGRSEQLEPPFVGRDPELRLLKDFYHGTARERGIRLVSVVGQGGIGKSRLAWEFQKYLDGISEPVFWQQGRSPAYGDGISFWALGEMVRVRAGIGEGADEATTRSRIASSVAEHVGGPAERPEVEGALLQLLGISDGQSRQRDALFLAWRTFWERLSEENAVVLVFEDLQWADTGLLDFIEYMLQWSRGHRIYIVTLARPELLDRRPTWGAGHRSFTSLGLGPLGGEDMAALLTGLVPGLPDAALREIVMRAEGVPMYAVETIRMLINEGRLVQATDDTYEVSGDLGEITVPESLHALIAARLDALAPEERGLMQDGAVLGQTFTVEALAAVHSAPEADVEARLRRLVQRELLTFDDDPRSPERGQFGFVQSLVREVAHSTLSRADRRTRHLAAARYYEAIGDDELAGVLAEHYLEAYRARPSGEEGAAVATQARIALRAAGARAFSVGAADNALGYAEQALEVATEPADRLELEWDAMVAGESAGRFDVAKRHAERGIELAQGLGDAYKRRRLVARLGDLLTEGFMDEAGVMLEAAIAEDGLTPETPGFAELASTLIKIHMRTDRDAEAVALADKALSVPEGVIPTDIRLDVIITRGTALSNLGKFMEATVTLTGASELARRLGDPSAMLRSAVNLGYATEPVDVAWGYQVSREGLELARRYGHRWAERYLLGNAIDGAIDTGDWEWARGQLADALDRDLQPEEVLWYNTFSAELGAVRGDDVDTFVQKVDQVVGEFTDAQFDYLVEGMRLEVAFCAGRLEEVCALTDAAVSIPVWGSQLASYGARAALHLGDLERARRYARAYRARPGNLTVARQRTMEAGIATLEGRIDEARRLYQEALVRWRDGGSRWEKALCQLDILTLGALEPAERQAAADEARTFFEEVGARPFLDRLDSSAGRIAASRRDVDAVSARARVGPG